jgi:nucleoside-diphosphate-sugar epimerase
MHILIAGGAGFIGSHIAEKLILSGHEVVILDGILAKTSGSPDNLTHLQGLRLISEISQRLEFLRASSIESVKQTKPIAFSSIPENFI